MLVPLTGALTYLIRKGIQNANGSLEWSSLYFDNKTGECFSHSRKEAADKLNSKGQQLFNEGRFSEAAEYCENAFYFSSNEHHRSSGNRARNEVAAINLNTEGTKLFNEGKYIEAEGKYKNAFNLSQVGEQKDKYEANRRRAQEEVCQQVLKLLNSAWYAENKAKNEQETKEAERLFEEALNLARESSASFPNNLELIAIVEDVEAKIEGNKLFNKGAELQESAVALMAEAHALRQEGKYKLAIEKFKEAEAKYRGAKEKFQKGGKNDRRFESCIEFINQQIELIRESREICENHSNLNIRITENSLEEESDKIEELSIKLHQNI